MTIVRWQPYRNPMLQMMNRFFDNMSTAPDADVTWAPRMEVVETENSYEVSAELPGIDPKEVKVEVQSNILTVSGEKRETSDKKDRNLYWCERAYGDFSRSFQLPALVRASDIKANFKNGILTVSLPKLEEAKPRQIQVKAD